MIEPHRDLTTVSIGAILLGLTVIIAYLTGPFGPYGSPYQGHGAAGLFNLLSATFAVSGVPLVFAGLLKRRELSEDPLIQPMRSGIVWNSAPIGFVATLLLGVAIGFVSSSVRGTWAIASIGPGVPVPPDPWGFLGETRLLLGWTSLSLMLFAVYQLGNRNTTVPFQPGIRSRIVRAGIAFSGTGFLWSLGAIGFTGSLFLNGLTIVHLGPPSPPLFLLPLFPFLFVLFLGLNMKEIGTLNKARMVVLAAAVLGLSFFLMPLIPESHFVEHCGTYFTNYGSASYHLIGKGTLVVPSLCA